MEVVLVDWLILSMLQGLAGPTNPWDDLGAASGRQATQICSILFVGLTNKEWHSLVSPSVEYSALRLAQSKLESVPCHRQFDLHVFVTKTFDQNMGVFSKLW